MHSLFKFISYLGLALTLLPCLFVFGGVIELATSKKIMIAGMFLWFGTAIFWIKPTSFEEGEGT
jgi:hypothetical protein